MSETEVVCEAPQPSAGTLLRQAREAAGLHIAALAVSLKVPVKKMEALEQDRFELLPDLVFARALASSVCRILKIDPAEILERLPQNNVPMLAYAGAGINTPFRPSGNGVRPSWWSQVSKTTLTAGAVLLLGAVVLIFLPYLKQQVGVFLPDASQTTSQTGRLATEPAAVSGSESKPAGIATPEPVAAVEPVAPASMATGFVSSTSAAATTNPQGVITTGLTPVLSSASVAGPADVVQFRAKSQSWVEVTDAKGAVVLRRMLGSGEVATASGVLPLAAVVGRADATQVEVRGQIMDLSKFSRDNVARFEVK